MKPVSNPQHVQPAGQGARRWALASLSLVMLLSSLGTSVANVALPTLSQVFAASFQQVQWVVLAYLLAITTVIVSVGRLGDLFGRRRLLLVGIGLFTVASLGSAVPMLGVMIAARALQGVGAAIMMALSMAFVADIVPRERTGRAMGLLGTMSATGTALGPSLGGVLIAVSGWQAIFLINVPLGVAAFWLAFRKLPADGAPKANRARFDYPGTVLLALTLAAYALAMTLGRGQFGLLNMLLLLAAALGMGAFVFAQAKAAAPLVRLAMLREPRLRAGLAMSLLVSTVLMTTLVIGPFYLSRALSLGTALVGAVMSVGPIVAALCGVPAGRMVDHLGTRSTTLIGLGGMLCGYAVLCMLPTRFGVPAYLAPMIIITAGYALFQAANNTMVMTGIAADQRGVVSGLLNLSRNLGLITGASVMGAVFMHASGTVDIALAPPDAVASGMRISFGIAGALVAVGVVIGSRAAMIRTALAAEAR
ncbi:Riboflavin transporter RibZ [Andreprevotia sp. IGB-42]|uniref:MFS transporter n=1 Tax=Andreprevotia sp. IGB-42 TaxID=2497473 RepID=UPI0013588C6F|nr:MFS transporter [Andreprevotia sp. IGB-42]KAF0812080.1 Riboflavin transporter RibZ [Andreprevotia sp. IGB-42]